MTARLHLAAVVAVFVAGAGCGDKSAPARPVAPAPAVVAPAAALAASGEPKRDPAAQEWSYSSVGKRDPFRSFLADIAISKNQAAASRCTTPLGRFDVEQLRLVAVVTGLEDPVAMVEAPNGIGYSLRRGACIGRNGGVISAVRTGEVVISEWIVRADGTRDRAQTLLRLPREASLNIEE